MANWTCMLECEGVQHGSHFLLPISSSFSTSYSRSFITLKLSSFLYFELSTFIQESSIFLGSKSRQKDTERKVILSAKKKGVICEGKVCDLVIGGSMKNIISKEIVDKLKLPTTKHPHPYEVGWLKKGHVIPATSQRLVKLTMGGNKRYTLHTFKEEVKQLATKSSTTSTINEYLTVEKFKAESSEMVVM
ncbi:hypothetical protein GH714_002580 [Hevea brasiliensis]|uniref:Uncharacterized protein n=1 Tax=Hevea brasiliensis TaxID=3981 RepID=A0A6A6MWL7_HEVBR|nr:hypothetical protein GH714_002580 [Hevea brasiliensis]